MKEFCAVFLLFGKKDDNTFWKKCLKLFSRYYFWGATGFYVKLQKNVLNAVRHSRSVEDNFASQDAFL